MLGSAVGFVLLFNATPASARLSRAAEGPMRSSSVAISTQAPDDTAWTQTGLTDKAIRSLAASGSRLIAGTPFGGVFLSTDNGGSWTQRGLEATSVQSLAVTRWGALAGSTGGVFSSDDSGATWRVADSALTSRDVNCMVVNGADVFAGTWHGVILSTDVGRTWTQRGLRRHTVKALAVQGPLLFAGTSSAGVWTSDDRGASWTQTGLRNTDVHAILESGRTLIAGTWRGVYVSTDSGVSWMRRGLSDYNVTCLENIDGDLVAGTWAGGVFLSTDGGTDWTPFNAGLTDSNIWAIARRGRTLFVGTLGDGVWRREIPGGDEVHRSRGNPNGSMSKKEKE